MDRDSLKLLLAQGLSVAAIARRFGKDPSTISYWMEKYDLEANNREKHAAKGGLERERLEELVEAGASLAEIAKEVDRSVGTVRHWMREYGLRTKNGLGRRRRKQAALSARKAGLLTATMTCQRHGDTEFFLEARGYYRCKKCRAERVVKRRREIKALLVEEAGGKCAICGYDRCIKALQFHHLDPEVKSFNIALRGVARSLERARDEARKCVLLCANCHVELEAGVVPVPARVSAAAPATSSG